MSVAQKNCRRVEKVGDRGVKPRLWPRKTAGGLRKWAEEARNHAYGPEKEKAGWKNGRQRCEITPMAQKESR